MSEEEFFGENLINNLIIFLKVDPAKVRIAGVRPIGGGSRRKRATSGLEVLVEIGTLVSGYGRVCLTEVLVASEIKF